MIKSFYIFVFELIFNTSLNVAVLLEPNKPNIIVPQ